jgi:hypothetical protein
VDWSKLDAGLAAAVAEDADPTRRFVVFVHLDPEGGGVLTGAGIDAAGEGQVRTATLSALQVATLSDRDQVRRLVLSLPLRPTDQTSKADL